MNRNDHPNRPPPHETTPDCFTWVWDDLIPPPPCHPSGERPLLYSTDVATHRGVIAVWVDGRDPTRWTLIP